jgi:hypothetical protein
VTRGRRKPAGPGAAEQVLSIFAHLFFGLLALSGALVTLLGLWSAVQGQPWMPVVVTGLVFAGMGAGGIAGFRMLMRAFHRDAAVREEAARRPGATVPPQGSVGLLGPVLTWIGAGFVLIIVGPATFLGWDNIRRYPPALVMMPIFWAVGLFLVWRAVLATLRYARFGASLLRLDAAPSLGRYLEGVIEAPAALMDAAAVEVKVECLRTEYWTYNDAARRRDKHVVPIWRQTAVLDTMGLARTAMGVQVPVSIALAADAEASGQAGEKAEITWMLTVHAALPGVDYVESFSLDVGPAVAAPAPPPSRSMPTSSRAQAAPRGYRLARRGDGVRVRFPQQTSLLVWPLLILAAAVLLAFLDGQPFVRRYHLGLDDWGGIALAVVFALDVVSVMAVGSGVDIADGTVRLRRGPFGILPGRSLPRSAIAQVRPQPSHSTPPRYAIEFVTSGGDTTRSGYGLDDVEEAQRLAAELQETARNWA